MNNSAPAHAANAPARPLPPLGRLSRELAGDLPCVQCGYNLKGLTVKGMCPECGISVRTTLLAVVDPRASEFRKIEFPHAIALGLMLWSGAALLACVFAWLLQLAYIFRPQAPFAADAIHIAEWCLLTCGLVSWIGSFALIRPHAGLSVASVLLAILGVIAYLPLLWASYELYVRMGFSLRSAYSSSTMEARAPLRLIASAAGLVILMGLRPNARTLQARWLLMRIGAVTRQTMFAMVIVIFVWVAADTMVLVAGRFHGGPDEILRMVAKLLILVGAIFLSVGIFSITMDCWHIRAVVLRQPLSIDQLLNRSHQDATLAESGVPQSPTTPSTNPIGGWSGT